MEWCQQLTLSWISINSSSASLDNGIGGVATQGSKVVSPLQSTVYTLTVQGPNWPSTCTTHVNVAQQQNDPPSTTSTQQSNWSWNHGNSKHTNHQTKNWS